MHSFPYSARVLFLSAVVILLSLSTNITPRANALRIVRARYTVSNDVAVDPRAIDAKDPFESNGNKQRDGIFGPEQDQDGAAIIPRGIMPAFVGSRPHNKRPKDKTLAENTSEEDNGDAPTTDTEEEDMFEEDPPKTHKTGRQKKILQDPMTPRTAKTEAARI